MKSCRDKVSFARVVPVPEYDARSAHPSPEMVKRVHGQMQKMAHDYRLIGKKNFANQYLSLI
jgi:hypothetical protein